MRVALVNPDWDFAGSIYFGCREPHLPLEFGYAAALLANAGHTAAIVDAQAEHLDDAALRARVADFAPDMIVVATAPSYLFWRCAPPELRVPQTVLRALTGIAALRVVVGPHGSTTPRAALRKLAVDAVVLGECEEVLVRLASTPHEDWGGIAGLCHRISGEIVVQGGPQAVDIAKLPALYLAHGEACSVTPIITIGLILPRPGPVLRWRHRAAARITAPFAPRRISATAIAGARLPRLSQSSTAYSRPASDMFILSTRFSCRGANYSKRLLGVQLCLACRPASICGATTCSICWVRRVAYRSRRGSKVSPRRAVIGSTRIAASRPTN